jgi:hypothetical protein
VFADLTVGTYLPGFQARTDQMETMMWILWLIFVSTAIVAGSVLMWRIGQAAEEVQKRLPKG